MTTDQPVAAPSRVSRPLDAAGLVLIRDGRSGPEVLLGRRHRRAGFLPDIYVFPGGRLDPHDAAPSGFAEPLHPAIADQLRRGGRGRPALAFARAALRETFEETGLLLGRSAPSGSSRAEAAAPIWQAFGASGLEPAFDRLDFVCRAITPTNSKRRYNTRFFLADGGAIAGELRGDGELEDLAWRPVSALGGLTIVDVTEFVLAEALHRWRLRCSIGAEPARLFCYRGETARWRIGDGGNWRATAAGIANAD